MSTKLTIVEGNSNDKDNVRAIMVKGERGYSAYEIAVQNGYTGTEAEWKDSFLNADNYYNKSEVDTSQNNQNTIINKKPYYFNNVAEMQACNLSVGDMAITLGYYTANDGGGATYKITNIQSQTDYQENLTNELYATLIINDNNNVHQFGAKGDGITDDSNSINSALSKTKKIIFFNKTYLISNPLVFSNNEVIGDNTTISANSNFNGNYMAIPHNTVIIKNITFDCDDNCICCLGESSNNTKLDINNCIFTNAHENINEDLFALNSSAYLCAKEINVTNSKFINNKSHGARLKANYEHTNVNIDNCVFSYNGISGEIVAVGLAQYGSEEGTYYDKVTIQNCFAEHNGNTGISPHSCNNIIISNCVSNNNGEHGFCLMNGKNGEINNCIAIKNVKYGIRIQGDYSSVSEYTGYKNFIITNNYLVGSGIDMDNKISNGIITNNLIEYAVSLSSETSKGIRIERLNRNDIITNIDILNNKVNGYERMNSIRIFSSIDNTLNFDNYINNKRVKNYYGLGTVFDNNSMNDLKYSDVSNNKLLSYDDFSSNWTIPSETTVSNNIFTTDGEGSHYLAYQSISFTKLPRFISIYSEFEKINEDDIINLSLGIRFRNGSSLINNTTFSLYEECESNSMCRIYDTERFTSTVKEALVNSDNFDVIISIKDLAQIKINKVLCALSNEPPILPNN